MISLGTIDRNMFADALSKAFAISSSNNGGKPPFVYLCFQQGKLVIYSFNNSQKLQLNLFNEWLHCPLCLILLSKKILNVLATDSYNTIDIEYEPTIDRLRLIMNGCYDFSVTNVDNVNLLPDTEQEQNMIPVAGKNVCRMINRVLPCCATSDGKYSLNGIHIETEGNTNVIFVATDGAIFASQTMPILQHNHKIDFSECVMLPVEGAKILKTFESEYNLIFWNDRLEAKNKDFVFQQILASGRFPRWRNIIPDVSSFNGIPISVEQLVTCVRRVRSILDTKQPVIAVDIKAGHINFKTYLSNDVAYDTIDCAFDVEACHFLLDPNYLLSVISKLAPETELRLYPPVGNRSSVLITSEDGLTFVIMTISETEVKQDEV